MTKSLRFFIPAAIFCVLLVPFLASAQRQSGLVVCGNLSGDQCAFSDVINEVQVVLNFLIFRIASPLAAVMFAYAGYLYVTNRGNESQVKEAHDIFWNVFLGLVMALAAWVAVNFILTFFFGASSPFNLLTAP